MALATSPTSVVPGGVRRQLLSGELLCARCVDPVPSALSTFRSRSWECRDLIDPTLGYAVTVAIGPRTNYDDPPGHHPALRFTSIGAGGRGRARRGRGPDLRSTTPDELRRLLALEGFRAAVRGQRLRRSPPADGREQIWVDARPGGDHRDGTLAAERAAAAPRTARAPRATSCSRSCIRASPGGRQDRGRRRWPPPGARPRGRGLQPGSGASASEPTAGEETERELLPVVIGRAAVPRRRMIDRRAPRRRPAR